MRAYKRRSRDLGLVLVSLRFVQMYTERLTSRVSSAPENNGAVLVLLCAQDVMELDGESVEMADVQRAKIMVESVVQKSIVDGEIAWLRSVRLGGERGRTGSSSLTSLLGGSWQRLLGVRERRVWRRRMDVGGKVKPV